MFKSTPCFRSSSSRPTLRLSRATSVRLLFTKTRTTSACPRTQAMCNGAAPFYGKKSIDRGFRSGTDFIFKGKQNKIELVSYSSSVKWCPTSFFISVLAPCCSNKDARGACPLKATRWSAVSLYYSRLDVNEMEEEERARRVMVHQLK